MSSANGYRWSKFWWQDWQNDPTLKACSFAAQGLWMRLLCLAHEAMPRGSVLINGHIPTPRQLVAQVGGTEREITKLLVELEREGVFSRDPDGTIYSRRMRRDDEASEAGREHIAKRWKDHEPNRPPNRGATTKPNGVSHSPPSPDPITRSVEAESEAKREEERVFNKNNPFTEKKLASARANEAPPDGLNALLEAAGVEVPGKVGASSEAENAPDAVGKDAVLIEIAKVRKSLAMRIPYGEVRSAEAQTDALKAQPKAVGSEASMGLVWRPAEPVLSVQAQIAAALEGCTPAQIEAARRYGRA